MAAIDRLDLKLDNIELVEMNKKTKRRGWF